MRMGLSKGREVEAADSCSHAPTVCCHRSATKVLCLNPSCSSLATVLLLLCILALSPYFTAGWINSTLALVVLSAIAAPQIYFKSCSFQIKPTHFCRHFIISAFSESGEAFSYVPRWPNIHGWLPKTRAWSLICKIWRFSNPPVNKPVTQRSEANVIHWNENSIYLIKQQREHNYQQHLKLFGI